MKKQFITNIILLLLINVLVKPLYVLYIETGVQNELGTENFGLYFYHLNFVYLFQFAGDFGLQTWNNQFISKNRESTGNYIVPVLLIKLGLSLLWLLLVWITGYFTGAMDMVILVLIWVNLMLSTWFTLLRTFISGLGHYTLDSWLSALDKLIMVGVLGFLLWQIDLGRAFTMNDFIFGQMFSLLLAIAITGFFLWQKSVHITLGWDKNKMAKILQQCYPFALIVFLMVTYSKMDGFLLGLLLHDGGLQAGIYAATYRIYDAANMFLYMIPALVLPMFSHLMSKGEEVESLYNLVLRWLFVLFGPILVVTIVFGEDILSWLYIEHVQEKTFSLRILMMASVLVCFAYIFGALSMAADKVSALVPVFLSGLVLNVILHLLLITRWGASGAAMATLLTQVWVFVGQYLIVSKKLSFRWDISVISRGMLYWVLLLATGWVLDSAIVASKWIPVVCSVIISLPLALLIKLFDISDFAFILSQKKNR